LDATDEEGKGGARNVHRSSRKKVVSKLYYVSKSFLLEKKFKKTKFSGNLLADWQFYGSVSSGACQSHRLGYNEVSLLVIRRPEYG
jgi:hypothetical protein